MKLFSSKKKIAIIGAMVTTMLAGSIAYAASAVKQDAYYDTFKFIVNGTEQYISDIALKPFIANNRVYVPISTLNNLGIANAQWVPAQLGQGASLVVTQKPAAQTGELALYQQQIAALNTNLQTKDTEIATLKSDKIKLEAEIERLKKEASTSGNTGSSGTTISTRDLDALASFYNDSRSYNRYNGPQDVGVMDIDFEVDENRGYINIDMYIYNKLDSNQISQLRNDYRYFDAYIEDIAKQSVAKFKNHDVVITLYNGHSRSNPSRIAEFEYDGRLRDSIQN